MAIPETDLWDQLASMAAEQYRLAEEVRAYVQRARYDSSLRTDVEEGGNDGTGES